MTPKICWHGKLGCDFTQHAAMNVLWVFWAKILRFPSTPKFVVHHDTKTSPWLNQVIKKLLFYNANSQSLSLNN